MSADTVFVLLLMLLVIMTELHAWWLSRRLEDTRDLLRESYEAHAKANEGRLDLLSDLESSIDRYDAALDVIAELTGLSKPHELVRLRMEQAGDVDDGGECHSESAPASKGPERVQKCPITTCKGKRDDDE